MILAGDIGGTNTRLALFELVRDRLSQVVTEVYSSPEYGGLEEVLARFTATHSGNVESACFGVAGPVIDGICRTPNLPWVVDSRALATGLDLQSVGLINDLEANAHGLSSLGEADFVVLHAGERDANGNAALISAGTGLGEAGLHWDGDCYRPFATEGGHADFAPRSALEIDLLAHLLKSYDHVSYERVLSGPGLVNIYRFLVETGRGEEPPSLRDEIANGDPAAVISRAALEGDIEICVRALDMFVSILGAEAGNLALKLLASGGVFLGGGIAPKILAKLEEPIFREAFLAKGRMRPLLVAMPIKVVINDQAALLGAAHVALHGRQC